MQKLHIIFYLLTTILSHSQPNLEEIFYKDFNYSNCIKSSTLTNNENELLDPIIKLNSNQTLKLSFDDLDNNLKYYMYTFIHCDSNWGKSEIIYSEYLNGFYENYIEEYYYSFNTIQQYIHYELTFPNENINFLKSGNYIIIIYDEYMNPILTKRFIVYEDILRIKSNVKRGTFSKDFDTKHEIDFEIYLDNFSIQNPFDEISIIIQQNDDWNNVKKNVQPSFVGKNIIKYDYEEQTSFNAGNEFRKFEISNIDFFSENVDSIYLKEISENTLSKEIEVCKYISNDMLYASLKKDFSRNINRYFNNYDLNGKQQLFNERSNNSEYESEYIMVNFHLKYPYDKSNDIYVYGAISNWEYQEKFRLKFDEELQLYTTRALLKQGYYDYQYKIKNKYNENEIEGNYFETKNEYTIYVYYKPIWARYEKIIGINKITSNNLD
ncbi:MAG: hypothetical protein CMP74_02750 [Flavobacteriales bacterium]|nr:hypothetical protein [Flavobacteriales bacterium]